MAAFDSGAFSTSAFSVSAFSFPAEVLQAVETPIVFADDLVAAFSEASDSVRVDVNFDVDSVVGALTIDD